MSHDSAGLSDGPRQFFYVQGYFFRLLDSLLKIDTFLQKAVCNLP